MKRFKLFYGDFLETEEIGTHFFDCPSHIPEGSVEILTVNRPSQPEIRFKAFLDGTMKIYRVARAAYTGTPLFVATIACALLEKGKDRRLRNTRYSRILNLIIFPFERYLGYIKRNLHQQVSNEIQRLIEDLRFQIKRSVRNFGGEVYEESEFIEDPKGVFGKSGNWIICDTSEKGIQEEIRQKEKELVKEEDLYNPQQVREKARARARHYMGLLEFYCAYSYLEDRPNNYLMVDGLFYPYRKVGGLFKILPEEYKAMIGRVVGLIKHPRDIPHEVFQRIPTLKFGECFHWIGKPSEIEENANVKREI